MKRTWVFLKLRLLQLKSDRTSLFFSYVLPVLLLLGIGYPLQMNGGSTIALSYVDNARQPASDAFLEALRKHPLVQLKPYAGLEGEDIPPDQALERNEVKHYLELRPTGADPGFTAFVYANSLAENQVENTAIRAVIDEALAAAKASPARMEEVRSKRYTSYLVILLPGVIGMTLLIIGLNGFGGVLIEEEHHGLFKNIKSIDASPLPFLAGLFISRLLIAYSVAVALWLIGVLVFGIPAQVNYALLLLVVTLGCVAFLGMGLLLATLSPSVNAFSGIVNFVQMPLIILGGVFFSVSAFPDWLQFLSRLMPLTQLNTAMRELLFDSVGFQDMGKLHAEIAVLAVWCVFTLVLARMRFKW